MIILYVMSWYFCAFYTVNEGFIYHLIIYCVHSVLLSVLQGVEKLLWRCGQQSTSQKEIFSTTFSMFLSTECATVAATEKRGKIWMPQVMV